MSSETITVDELEKQFQKVVNAPLSELRENVAGEFTEIIHASDWVHIAFIRFGDDVSKIGIEVEVSLPSGSCGESLIDHSSQIKLLQGMMTHIIFIKHLLKQGFNLSVIKEDCLWVAYYLSSGHPSQEVLEALVPPFMI